MSGLDNPVLLVLGLLILGAVITAAAHVISHFIPEGKLKKLLTRRFWE